MKKKKVILICGALLFYLILLCVSHYEKSNMNIDNGYYLNVYTDINSKLNEENGTIEINSGKDLMYAEIENIGKKRQFALKVYLDYKEVGFYIDKEEYLTYIIDASDGYREIIPFTLNMDIDFKKNHKLTVILISGSDIHANIIDDAVTNNYSLALNFNLICNKNMPMIQDDNNRTTTIHLEENNFQGILLNTRGMLHNSNKLPDKEMVVNTSSKVRLDYRIGSYDNVQEYLILLCVGWESVLIDGNEYKIIELNKPGIAFGELSFIAPENSGEYEVTAWIIPNPFKYNTDDFTPLDSSYRFTLKVVK